MFSRSRILAGKRLRCSRSFSNKPASQTFSRFSYSLGGLFLGGVSVWAFTKISHSESPKAIGTSIGQVDASTTHLEDVAPPVYANDEEFKNCLKELRKILAEDKLLTDEEDADNYADSAFNSHHAPNPEKQKPSAVIYPASTEEVSEVLKILHKYRVPIVAGSGYTSVEGHTLHLRGPNSVALSFEQMDQIVAVHPGDLDAVVQAGIGWQDLDEYLLSNDDTKHLMFGPDPGPGARIGGMVATSCSGTNAYKYGTMKENVINLTVVLADGTIVKTRKRPRKTSAGYDLTRLFIGAEGTLGVVTEVTVRLSVRPVEEFVSMAPFETVYDACSAAEGLIQRGIGLNALEMVDSTMVSFVNRYAGLKDAEGNPRKFLEKPTLLFKIGGPNQDAIRQQFGAVEEVCNAHNVLDIVQSKDQDENAVLWGARKNGLLSTLQYGPEVLPDKNDIQVWTTDIAVPISALATVISETDEDLQKEQLGDLYSTMGHVGDGNCHFIILFNSKDYKKIHAVVDRMVYRALKYEGTCTGEHGVGIGKRRYLVKELSTSAVDLMRHIKLLLDPRRILNPDKVVRLDHSDNIDELVDQAGSH